MSAHFQQKIDHIQVVNFIKGVLPYASSAFNSVDVSPPWSVKKVSCGDIPHRKPDITRDQKRDISTRGITKKNPRVICYKTNGFKTTAVYYSSRSRQSPTNNLNPFKFLNILCSADLYTFENFKVQYA